MGFLKKRPAFKKTGPPFGKAGARGVKWMFMQVRVYGYAVFGGLAGGGGPTLTRRALRPRRKGCGGNRNKC